MYSFSKTRTFIFIVFTAHRPTVEKLKKKWLDGTCFSVTEIKDPCTKLNCSQGSQCVRSRDGSEASCECLESCPSLGDHEGSSPVCGTDGADYPSLCEMNRAACAKGANITMAFQGKCGEYWKNSEKNISSTLDYAFSSLWNPLSKIILVILLLLKYVTTIIDPYVGVEWETNA